MISSKVSGSRDMQKQARDPGLAKIQALLKPGVGSGLGETRKLGPGPEPSTTLVQMFNHQTEQEIVGQHGDTSNIRRCGSASLAQESVSEEVGFMSMPLVVGQQATSTELSNAMVAQKQKPRKAVAVGESKIPKTDVWFVIGLVLAGFWVNQNCGKASGSCKLSTDKKSLRYAPVNNFQRGAVLRRNRPNGETGHLPPIESGRQFMSKFVVGGGNGISKDGDNSDSPPPSSISAKSPSFWDFMGSFYSRHSEEQFLVEFSIYLRPLASILEWLTLATSVASSQSMGCVWVFLRAIKRGNTQSRTHFEPPPWVVLASGRFNWNLQFSGLGQWFRPPNSPRPTSSDVGLEKEV
ncbi:hypothetical protein C8R43DRAFT_943296 [Mycena crocata]|nr:hypothetical protein C8R43DRAFT_943296 [Mycena crocata]